MSYPDTDTLSINPADVLREKQRLIEILKIPISNLVFSRFYCEILLAQHAIGFLPISQSAAGIQYDVGKTALQKLNWARVYSIHQADLRGQVAKGIKLNSFNVIPASFRRLYIEDMENQLIASFHCAFENQSWIVSNEGLLA
ncbi:MAG TPA: hypothetical protein VKQ08_10440 [Cyclobacteriaceae bacterium]|nr:hypothetical protein [Cyclobacteriaceae bacterium]